MKIEVCPNGGKRIRIIFPISFIAFVIKFIPKFVFRYIPKDDHTVPNIEEINFNELSRAFYQLRKYKGLKLVEVKSRDGTKVTIQI